MSTRRNATVGAVITALMLAGASAPPAVAASTVTFSATYGTDAGLQLDDARLLNGSQGGYAVTKNLHLLPETLGQVNSTGVRSVRIDHIFDDDFYGLVSRDSAGALTFDFTKLDSVVLPLFDQGMVPWFTLSYMPGALAKDKFTAPSSLTDWSTVVSTTVKHYADLGHAGLNWEVWNEPDFDFWKSGASAFNDLYAASASAVKSADSTAQIGGPAVYNIQAPIMGSFLDYIAANPTVAFDFVSWHDYGDNDFSKSATVAGMLSSRKIPAKKQYVTEWHTTAAFGSTPGGDADTNVLASYAARRLTSALLQPTLNGVFFFSPVEGWNPTADFSTDLGLLTVEGHRKAVGNVFEMFDIMPSTVLTSTTSGAPTDRSVGAIATADTGSKTTAFLAWNDGTDASTVSLSASSLPFASSNFSVTRYDVNATAGNYYADWSAGTRNRTTGPNELLRPSSVNVSAPASTWSSQVSMPAKSVSLFVLSPATQAAGAVSLSTPTSSTNVARASTVTSSSSYTGGGWGGAKLVDGRRHTYNASDTGGISQGFTSDATSTAQATQWVQLDLGSTKTFDTATLWPRDDQDADGSSFPVDFTLAGSNDGSTWTSLVSRTGYKAGQKVTGPQVFSTGKAAYRYVRLTATKQGLPVTEGTSQVSRLQLAELELTNTGLSNPGFETGDLSSWSVEGAASVVSTVAYDGRNAATFTGAGKGVYQVVSGLTPNTTYTFTGFAKSAAGEPVYIGAKNFGGTEVSTPVTTGHWKQTSVTFTTGSSATSALLYFYKNSGTAQAWVDGAVLVAQ